MKYNVIPTPKFEEDLDFYERKRKYTNIEDDLEDIINNLKNGNFVGDEVPNLKLHSDTETYKVRAANTNTKVGKSNGYRLIYYVVKNDYEIFLLTVYYKKDDNRVLKNQEIIELIEKYCM
jgi:mRNA-degrading endonuclease RelE of RelBE toxin-antitoxin system